MFGETWSHGTLVKSLGNVHPLSSPCSTRRFQPLQAPSRQLSQFKCGSFRTSGWFITACHSAAFMLHTSSLPRSDFSIIPHFFPEAKYQRKVAVLCCKYSLTTWPWDTSRELVSPHLDKTVAPHHSHMTSLCWVSGDIPAFSHSYFPWSVHVRTFCLFPRVPV